MFKNSVLIMLSAFFSLFSDISEAAETQKRNECVILLHGIGRSKRSMRFIESCLSDKGYRTYNPDYPSTRKTIQEIAEKYIPSAIAKCQGADKIHFVVHSMGGIIIRQYLQNHSLPKGSRIVMLATPNHGSEVTDFFKNFFLYKWLYGPAGQQLGTESDSLPNILRPIDVEVGIITGNTSFDPCAALIPGPGDGKVSVESAKLKEMKDFLAVPFGHTFLMNHSIVMKQVAHFLEHGMFEISQ